MPTQPKPTVTSATQTVKPMAFYGLISALREWKAHQVRINATGELVSTQAFNKQLKQGLIAELTSITNAKGQEFVVMEGKLVQGPKAE